MNKNNFDLETIESIYSILENALQDKDDYFAKPEIIDSIFIINKIIEKYQIDHLELFDIESLLSDDNHWVRQRDVRNGYGLATLIKDEASCVRAEVTKKGYGLDILIYDPDPNVRKAVAKFGYGLDILIND